ncbi:hypothetical protein COT99_03050 [Candidatus Falkowbacteria bacterium CG10_big_fil_rev_8_21_14_0_10_43_10]|uniref:Nudix hydrolase domain-containing protein n=1 Tax=Candidatus Falkowbacteria bacterium CG10_big_fil_rev_8_21_14_0_10_43_10 TaxID=1974567 RepID=A0A2H0V1U1_9BACT|nr:MAG: hypothetical protein COT99_03050 [Candidatus Falkowbacteria bacterium CG10_big_fil_rev_8_21_14_0_10_43_10]
MEKTVKRHISAGGVIYIKKGSKVRVLAMHRRVSDTWHLPKGTREDKEDILETAKREILEETGFVVDLRDRLGCLSSKTHRGVPKKTYYFIGRPVDSKSVQLGDGEHDYATFVEIKKLINLIKNKRVKNYEKEHLILEKLLTSGVPF